MCSCALRAQAILNVLPADDRRIIITSAQDFYQVIRSVGVLMPSSYSVVLGIPYVLKWTCLRYILTYCWLSFPG
jgi:hypothetical protein